ncbi:MAG: phenylalanine--tRNA ligase subunit alpha [Chloroflexi bacterium]|nr:phenylalanine--tRNA ligase subunit alpha [Chloroflexota bacterium]
MDATGLRKLADRAEAEIAAAPDEAALEALRVRYVGRRDGEITLALKLTPTLATGDRPAYGAAGNAARERVEAALDRRAAELRSSTLERDLRPGGEDLSLPPRRVRVGRYHPITQTIREVSRIFAGMGFETVEGPEVEWDYYAFEALNIPADHPARDKFSTLWVSTDTAQRMLLRPHTSPMQIRVMEKRRPPVRVLVPGRCFRYEATDATHESVFFQYEGLAIDEQLSMADLKGVLYSFARQLFGGDRKIRFRPDYFPFTEPSAEIAFDCFACDGTGVTNDGKCRTCGGAAWIEAAGCGMVHPAALQRVGYDPAQHQGFAFGGGIERLAMLLTGTPDIRLFHQNDMRYLGSL